MQVLEHSKLSADTIGRDAYLGVCYRLGIVAKARGYGALHLVDENELTIYEDGQEAPMRLTALIEDMDYFDLFLSTFEPTEDAETIDGTMRPALSARPTFEGMEIPHEKVTHWVLGWPDDWEQLLQRVPSLLLSGTADDA